MRKKLKKVCSIEMVDFWIFNVILSLMGLCFVHKYINYVSVVFGRVGSCTAVIT